VSIFGLVATRLWDESMSTESDSMATIEVPDDVYRGAQTARSLTHFKIGENRIPPDLIREIGILKKTAVLVNQDLGKLPKEKSDLILAAADEVIAGRLHEQFPLRIWQTGSGTQTHMNANEVISNRAIEIAGGKKGRKKPIHPNDEVNMSQSSNDTFPTAMYVAAAIVLTENLAPALKELHAFLETKSQELAHLVRTGRPHLQDATPLTVDQEVSGRSSRIERDLGRIRLAIDGFYALVIGGTADGTGLHTHPEFPQRSAKTSRT
jgi:fumarate hydratase, class II